MIRLRALAKISLRFTKQSWTATTMLAIDHINDQNPRGKEPFLVDFIFSFYGLDL